MGPGALTSLSDRLKVSEVCGGSYGARADRFIVLRWETVAEGAAPLRHFIKDRYHNFCQRGFSRENQRCLVSLPGHRRDPHKAFKAI